MLVGNDDIGMYDGKDKNDVELGLENIEEDDLEKKVLKDKKDDFSNSNEISINDQEVFYMLDTKGI